MDSGLFSTPERSDAIGALAAALAKAQGEISGAAKDKTNPHFKSAYADLASVWEACRTALSKNGLAVMQTVSADGPAVSVKTVLAHSSGEWISGVLTMTAQQNTPQGIGSCITYARRYSLASMVGVAPEDDDGNAASQGNHRTEAKPTMPDGFAEWWADLQAVADEGAMALEDAWRKSDLARRKYLSEHHKDQWERVKERAKKVKAGGVPA